MARRITRSAAPARKVVPTLLVYRERADGEDAIVTLMDANQLHTAGQLARGEIRRFDPARDDRGPEVPFIATYGMTPKTWFPLTSGTYLVEFVPGSPLASRFHLGMGSCTSPQGSRAKIHRVLLDILERMPALAGQLRVVKRPCVLCKDAPGHEGGSTVVIDPATLPAPVEAGKVDRTYM